MIGAKLIGISYLLGKPVVKGARALAKTKYGKKGIKFAKKGTSFIKKDIRQMKSNFKKSPETTVGASILGGAGGYAIGSGINKAAGYFLSGKDKKDG